MIEISFLVLNYKTGKTIQISLAQSIMHNTIFISLFKVDYYK